MATRPNNRARLNRALRELAPALPKGEPGHGSQPPAGRPNQQQAHSQPPPWSWIERPSIGSALQPQTTPVFPRTQGSTSTERVTPRENESQHDFTARAREADYLYSGMAGTWEMHRGEGSWDPNIYMQGMGLAGIAQAKRYLSQSKRSELYTTRPDPEPIPDNTLYPDIRGERLLDWTARATAAGMSLAEAESMWDDAMVQEINRKLNPA